MYLNLFGIAVLLIFSISACTSENKGTQGEWSDFSYTVGTDDEERLTQARVLVENSNYRNYRERIQFVVEWKAINTGKVPANFAWRNKALMDSQGRIFEPYQGQYAEGIQPLDETHSLTIRYNLPRVVNAEELYWGLYHGDPEVGLKYRVELLPEKKDN